MRDLVLVWKPGITHSRIGHRARVDSLKQVVHKPMGIYFFFLRGLSMRVVSVLSGELGSG